MNLYKHGFPARGPPGKSAVSETIAGAWAEAKQGSVQPADISHSAIVADIRNVPLHTQAAKSVLFGQTQDLTKNVFCLAFPVRRLLL